MYKKILVALDESPEARRALQKGIDLAKFCHAELYAITVQEEMPPYMPYVEAVAPDAARVLEAERRAYYINLQAEAEQLAASAGLVLHVRLTEDQEVAGITSAVSTIGSDLLIVGVHRRTESLSRLLGSTAYKLAQATACDILGVH
jgi:nucleotide-binding universal stress UspA family protein